MELTLPPVYTGRNFKNGRWLKGVTPFNKGKKWSEYMSEDAQRRSAKGWKNLDLHRNKNGRSDAAGRAARKVVIVFDDGSWTVLPSLSAAALWMKGRTGINYQRENVRRCCKMNREPRIIHNTRGKATDRVNTDHRYYGVRFYYESDVEIWTKKIK